MAEPRLLVLGDLRFVATSGETITRWPTRKSGELFAMLAMLPGPTASRETVGNRLWPEADSETIRNRLKQAFFLLRKTLGASFPLPEADARHLFSRVPVRSDADDFVRAVIRADRAPAPEKILPMLEEALTLWRGPFLAGWDSEWIEEERVQWAARYVSVALRAAKAHAFAERFESALAWAEAAQRVDPFDEVTASATIRYLLRLDRKAAAVRLYREYAAKMKREFDAEPGPELRRVLALALRREPDPTLTQRNLFTAALPADRSREDAARLLGVLRREGILSGVGTADGAALRSDLLGALSQVASSLTGPERESLRRVHTARVVREVRGGQERCPGAEGEQYLSNIDQAQGEIPAALAYLAETSPREGLELAIGLQWWWYTRGRYAEGRQFLEHLLARTPPEQSKEQANALLASGHFANCMGDNRVAFSRYHEARAIYRAIGDRDGEALSLMREGNAAMEEGLLVPAYRLCHKAAAHFRARSDDRNLLTALFYAHQTANWLGRMDDHNAELADLQMLANSLGDLRYQRLILYSMSQLQFIRGMEFKQGPEVIIARCLGLLRERTDVMTIIYIFQSAANTNLL